jgi:transcriptional regulator with XRE-family HTH domain
LYQRCLLDRITVAERDFPHRRRTPRRASGREVVVVEQPTPRPILRQLRNARGWTQQDVADRLVKLAWMRKPRKNVGCNAQMVSKWEAGRRGISPLYRELLAKLYGVTIDQLGIDPDTETAPDSSTDRSLLSFLDTATGLLDQLGAAGAVLQPQMFALWKDEIANRRAMFALLDPLIEAVPAKASLPLDLDVVDQLADKYERLYDTADPAALLAPVAAHVQMVGDALRQSQSASDRQRLLRSRVRVAVLAGRLAFQRLKNTMSARAFYSVAHDDARELGDDTLRATVLSHTAQLAAAEGRPVAALDDLTTARTLVSPDSDIAHRLGEIADDLATRTLTRTAHAA